MRTKYSVQQCADEDTFEHLVSYFAYSQSATYVHQEASRVFFEKESDLTSTKSGRRKSAPLMYLTVWGTKDIISWFSIYRHRTKANS